MSGDTTGPPGSTPADRYVEASRTLLERSLAAQRAAVDGWAAAVDRASPTGEASTARRAAWPFDVWAGTLENALVHLDDAVTDAGVDLDALGMIWLHAADDALSEVGARPAFAATTDRAVERALTARYRSDELRRATLAAAGVPTDRDVEEVGKRLLDLEYRQKSIEDKLDAVVRAVDAGTEPGPAGAEPAPDRDADPDTDADATGGDG